MNSNPWRITTKTAAIPERKLHNMNKSNYFVSFLNPNTQRAYAEKQARADEEETEAPKEKESGPVSPNIALLKRVQRIVFGPNVTDLAEAKTRLASLIDALDDEENEAKKKPA